MNFIQALGFMCWTAGLMFLAVGEHLTAGISLTIGGVFILLDSD